MNRILRATQSDIQVTLYDRTGVATDATGTPTVSVTRDDGTVLIASTATTKVAATTGVYQYTLSPTDTAALDVLTATWLAVVDGVEQTFTTTAEIVGGFLFSIADARALKPLDSTVKYPATAIVAVRSLAEIALEDACGVAFVPRYGRERIDGAANGDVLLKNPRPLTVTAAADTGLTVDPATLELYRDGRVYNPSMWSEGRRNVRLTYTHGYLFPPPRVGRACLLLAKRFLVDSPVNDRAMSVTNNEVTEYLVTAGVRDAVFDIPECNAVVQQYGLNYGVG